MAEKNVCISCGASEDPPRRRGAFYVGHAETGGKQVRFWLCHPCSFPLGFEQGPTPQRDDRDERDR